MSDETTTATATKKKRKTRERAPQTFMLVGVEKDDEGGITGFTRLPQPDVKDGVARREDIRRAVKKALEEGNDAAVKYYANRSLAVISFPEPFSYACEVEEVTVRKVVVKEG